MRLAEHKATSSPLVFDGKVYVGLLAGEEAAAKKAAYPCCKERGEFVSVSLATGNVRWRRYTMPPAERAGSWPGGAARYEPSGAGVWSSSAIDPVSRTVFYGTGNAFTGTSGDHDSVMALDADTGALRWKRQMPARLDQVAAPAPLDDAEHVDRQRHLHQVVRDPQSQLIGARHGHREQAERRQRRERSDGERRQGSVLEERPGEQPEGADATQRQEVDDGTGRPDQLAERPARAHHVRHHARTEEDAADADGPARRAEREPRRGGSQRSQREPPQQHLEDDRPIEHALAGDDSRPGHPASTSDRPAGRAIATPDNVSPRGALTAKAPNPDREGMPCAQHEKVAKGCVSCFGADLLAFTLNNDIIKMEGSTLDRELPRLVKRHGELKGSLSEDDDEYCDTLIFGLNTKLAARKHALFGAQLAVFLDPAAIQFAHRELYRTRLRRMGTWIGYSEFTTLAEIYQVRFWLAVPSGVRWRRWQVGTIGDTDIANPALLWTGNHYEVGTLTQHLAGQEYTASNVLQTNPRGDCALESFLLMLHAQVAAPNPVGSHAHRAARVLASFRRARVQAPAPGLIDASLDDYKDAIGELRLLLAGQMGTAQINDAIIAEGELPTSSKRSKKESPSTESSSSPDVPFTKQDKLDAWVKYRTSFERDFTITQTVVQGSAGKVTCVANIGTAADWLHVVQHLDDYDGWLAMKRDGLRHHVATETGSLTHTGLMVAQVTTQQDKTGLIFACAAANYHQSLRTKASPWIYKGSGQDLGDGRDMHTERFALVQLDTWIETQKLVPTGVIDILWFIEKPMCPDACVPVLKRFTDRWDARGVKVGSDVRSSNLHHDNFFNKNLTTVLKRFTALS